MIYITQLIYLKPGKGDVFDSFEAVVIPLISRYKGQLLLRVRPDAGAFIEGEAEPPYEIHLAAFPSEADLEAYIKDRERMEAMPLKDASVERIVMIRGNANA
jgi:hypothetical protein